MASTARNGTRGLLSADPPGSSSVQTACHLGGLGVTANCRASPHITQLVSTGHYELTPQPSCLGWWSLRPCLSLPDISNHGSRLSRSAPCPSEEGRPRQAGVQFLKNGDCEQDRTLVHVTPSSGVESTNIAHAMNYTSSVEHINAELTHTGEIGQDAQVLMRTCKDIVVIKRHSLSTGQKARVDSSTSALQR